VKPTSHSSPIDRADPHDFTLLVEARDFLRVHLPSLTMKQRRFVCQWACGVTCAEIAIEHGVTVRAAERLVRRAVERLRELGGDHRDRTVADVYTVRSLGRVDVDVTVDALHQSRHSQPPQVAQTVNQPGAS